MCLSAQLYQDINSTLKFTMAREENPGVCSFKWINKSRLPRPTEKDFNLPTNQEEWDIMKSTMLSCGLDESKIKSMMQERLEKLKKASDEFKLKEGLN